MDREKFDHEMLKATTMQEHGDRTDYWYGYQRGLRRRFHSEVYGTQEEHEIWMSLTDDEDEQRVERGRGYRDGFKVD